jgi:hypothetical protein
MPIVTRNRHWPDAISAYELLDRLRKAPASNTRLDQIALVVDFQDKGMREIVDIHYDEEEHLLVLQLP